MTIRTFIFALVALVASGGVAIADNTQYTGALAEQNYGINTNDSRDMQGCKKSVGERYDKLISLGASHKLAYTKALERGEHLFKTRFKDIEMVSCTSLIRKKYLSWNMKVHEEVLIREMMSF